MIEYALTKIVSVYRPSKVIDALYNKDSNIISYLREFLSGIIKKHADAEPKQIENKAMLQLIQIVDNLNLDVDINWLYNPTFEKFKDFLKENIVIDFELILDEEGSGENVKAASSLFKNVSEADSKNMPLIV